MLDRGYEMKIIISLSIVFLLSGCGAFERSVAFLNSYSKICVDGVEYIQFTSGASVSYNVDGSIKVCK
jgi:hypothetical protein